MLIGGLIYDFLAESSYTERMGFGERLVGLSRFHAWTLHQGRPVAQPSVYLLC